MLSLFGDASCPVLQATPYVVFDGERGLDLDGLSRDLFSIFWDEAHVRYFEGDVVMVPRINPHTCDLDNQLYHTLGRILAYGFVVTGHFPVFLAKAAVVSALCGASKVCNTMLISSFVHYIDEFERSTVQSFQEGKASPADVEVVLAMLSRFNCFTLPTTDNIERVLLSYARSELLCKPVHALMHIVIGMNEVHACVWDRVQPACLVQLYDRLIPPASTVWEAIRPPAEVPRQQDRILDFLRRFLCSLSHDDLALFLRFVTGCSALVSDIKIEFCGTSGLVRQPGANTCTSTLHLSKPTPRSWNSRGNSD